MSKTDEFTVAEAWLSFKHQAKQLCTHYDRWALFYRVFAQLKKTIDPQTANLFTPHEAFTRATKILLGTVNLKEVDPDNLPDVQRIKDRLAAAKKADPASNVLVEDENDPTPPGAPNPQGPNINLDDFDLDAPVDFRKDWLFVYKYIDVRDVTKEMAPSPGAWGMLTQCRSDRAFRHDFYKGIITKMNTTRGEAQDKERASARDIEIVQLIRTISRNRVDSHTNVA